MPVIHTVQTVRFTLLNLLQSLANVSQEQVDNIPTDLISEQPHYLVD